MVIGSVCKCEKAVINIRMWWDASLFKRYLLMTLLLHPYSKQGFFAPSFLERRQFLIHTHIPPEGGVNTVDFGATTVKLLKLPVTPSSSCLVLG